MNEGGRLWFGLVAAPAAWAADGLFGWWVGARICTSLSIGAVRLAVGVFSLVMLGIALAGLMTGLANWRAASAAPRAIGDRVAFMSLGGVLVSTAFLVGIVWAGLSAALLNVCGGMR